MNGTLQERLDVVVGRMRAACARAGRSPDTVQLLPVTKTFGPDTVQAAAALGLRVFGENRVQEALQKIPACPGHLQWHMVGHLQSNKVKIAATLFDMLQAVDSQRLLTLVEDAAQQSGRVLPVLLEVNVAGEASKFGLAPGGVEEVLRAAQRMLHVQVRGLMTVPPLARDPEATRPFFRMLRELRDDLQARTGVPLPELSMGMSGDFEVAIEEGATWIRLGAVLFGDRQRRVAEAAE